MKMQYRNPMFATLSMLLAFGGLSCARLETNNTVDVKPIEVTPIEINVNVNVRIQNELNDFFAFQDKYQPTTSTTRPATLP